jgi:hypothetical protein
MKFTTLKIPGPDAIRLLNEHRSRYPATGQYPFLIGDDTDLTNVKDQAESSKRNPAAIIRASLDIKTAEWIAGRGEILKNVIFLRVRAWVNGLARFLTRDRSASTKMC